MTTAHSNTASNNPFLGREALIVVALVAPLAVVAVVFGWRSIEVYSMNPDAGVFVEEARQLVATGEVMATRDPPLRYVPLAAIYAVLSPSSAALAGRIAHLYGAVCSWVLTPLALYALVRVVGDWRAGALSLLGVIALRLLDPGHLPYYVGSFQYSSAVPISLVALATVHLAITRPSPRRWGWAFVTGGLLGAVGLIQYAVAVFAIVATTLAYLAARRYRELGITGAVGTVCATPLFFLSGPAQDQIGSATRTVNSIDIGVGSILTEIASLFTTSGTLFFLVLGIVAGVFHHRAHSPSTESRVLELSVAVTGAVWIGFRVINAGYFQQPAYVFGQYILVGLLAHRMVAWSDDRGWLDAVVGRRPRRYHWIGALAVAVAATVALLAVVPRYAPGG